MKTLKEVYTALTNVVLGKNVSDPECVPVFVTMTDNNGGRKMLRVTDIVYKGKTVVDPNGKCFIVTEDE